METFKSELSEENRKLEFLIDPEDAYLKIQVKSIGNNSQKTEKRLYASVRIKIKKTHEKETEKIIDFNNHEISNFDLIQNELPEITQHGFEKLSLELLEGNTLIGFGILFQITKGKKRIEMTAPWDQFDRFLSNRINSKILFSAPFGAGKSTFLDHFFNERRDKVYNVFTLYPVNYSVSTNEDIFKYIKADILLQLLASDVEFDAESITFLRATEEYLYLKPQKAILSFLDTISLLNPKTKILSTGLNNLNRFVKEIKDYKRQESSEDKQEAINYIREIYEREGSLFEDNFFTQLIRQLLQQLKTTSDKENILVIEDLDRMDPDHIFRILNVISAHYDTFKFSDDNALPNKFGFDKIILVCDLNNIRNIYRHKYGANTEFQGYINKYFSTKPFEFINLQSTRKYLEEEIAKIHKSKYKDPRIDIFGAILRLLLESDQLTLREMIKLMTQDFETFEVTYSSNGTFEYGGVHKTLCFLIDLYGADELKKKFTDMGNKRFKTILNFDILSLNLLVGLGVQNKSIVQTKFKGHTYNINCSEHINYPILINLKLNTDEFSAADVINSGNPKKVKFSKDDFIELALKTIDEISLTK